MVLSLRTGGWAEERFEEIQSQNSPSSTSLSSLDKVVTDKVKYLKVRAGTRTKVSASCEATDKYVSSDPARLTFTFTISRITVDFLQIAHL